MSDFPVRYEPDEHPPHPLAAGLAAQVVALILTGILITPLVVGRAAGLDAGQTGWLVFAALLAAGLSTWLQASRWHIIGGGYALFVGSNVAFISVATAAIQGGGLALLATLGAISALFTFVFTVRLGALRRILTPAVGGTVLLLMSISVAPVVWGMLRKLPPGFETGPQAPLVMVATLVPIVGLALFGSPRLRLWAPLVGVLCGSALAAAFGMVDTAPVARAAWIGLPGAGWPGLSLDFGPTFWSLLPAFILITMVACIETFADGISVQRSSYRRERPIDFRAVQGAINADGLGSFIAAVLGTVPNTVYSTSVGVMELTGVAARRVAYWGGLFLMLLAFSPKIAAIVGAMPSTVAGAYILMLLVVLFGNGMRMVTEGGLGFEEGIAVVLGFWVGLGFQGGFLFNDRLPDWANTFLSNGTTSGGLTAMGLMGLLSLRRRAHEQETMPLDESAIARVRPKVRAFCTRVGWDEVAANRLMLAAEESLLFLLEQHAGPAPDAPVKRIRWRVGEVDGEAEIECTCAPAEINAQAVIANLPEELPEDPGQDLSLRVLRGISREVRHLQYHGVDYLVIRVDSRG